MADGERTLKLTLTLGEKAIRRLEQGAETLHIPLDAYASELLEQQLFNYDDYDWNGDDPRAARAEPYDPAAPTYSVNEVMATFDQELGKRLAGKA
jgi:hypothetical protein